MKAYIEAVKCKRKFSNCYFSVQELQDKWQKRKITVYETEEALLIVEREERVNHLYYLSDSWDWLCHIEEMRIENRPIVLSIVQRAESTEGMPFPDNGYPVYKTYQRLRKAAGEMPASKDISVVYCTGEDRSRLRTMMDDTFDVFSDNIPTEEELDRFIQNGNIICLRREDEVAGFIIFEDKGKTSYIRMVCIDGSYRGQGLGNNLMDIYFQIHKDCKSFTLWYDIENVPAYSLYCGWGYERESMYNLIFVL